MGISPSPYQAFGAALNMKRVALSAPSDPSNVFQWNRVVENLPGTVSYDPSKPWVYKITAHGDIAADLHLYVDDGRLTAKDEATAWLASSQLSKTSSYLGTQDALRKRWTPSQKPDDWFGTWVVTMDDGVFKTVSQVRLDKMKDKLNFCLREAREPMSGDTQSPARLHFKTLRKNLGYLVYMVMAFRSVKPYLKGSFLALYGWHGSRDLEGWQLIHHGTEEMTLETPEDAPEYVTGLPRFSGSGGILGTKCS